MDRESAGDAVEEVELIDVYMYLPSVQFSPSPKVEHRMHAVIIGTYMGKS